MSKFVIIFLVAVFLLAFILYKALFRRILTIRKNLRTLARSHININENLGLIAQCQQQDNIKQGLDYAEQCLEQFKVAYTSIDDSLLKFSYYVTNRNKKEFLLIEHIKAHALYSLQSINQADNKSKISQSYFRAVMLLQNMHSEYNLPFSSGFAWDRPDFAESVNLCQLNFDENNDCDSSQDESMLKDVLAKIQSEQGSLGAELSIVPDLTPLINDQLSLPAYRPLYLSKYAPIVSLMGVNTMVVYNLFILIHKDLSNRIKDCISQGKEPQNDVEVVEKFHLLERYVAKQRCLLWMLGAHHLIPSVEEFEKYNLDSPKILESEVEELENKDNDDFSQCF